MASVATTGALVLGVDGAEGPLTGDGQAWSVAELCRILAYWSSTASRMLKKVTTRARVMTVTSRSPPRERIR